MSARQGRIAVATVHSSRASAKREMSSQQSESATDPLKQADKAIEDHDIVPHCIPTTDVSECSNNQPVQPKHQHEKQQEIQLISGFDVNDSANPIAWKLSMKCLPLAVCLISSFCTSLLGSIYTTAVSYSTSMPNASDWN